MNVCTSSTLCETLPFSPHVSLHSAFFNFPFLIPSCRAAPIPLEASLIWSPHPPLCPLLPAELLQGPVPRSGSGFAAYLRLSPLAAVRRGLALARCGRDVRGILIQVRLGVVNMMCMRRRACSRAHTADSYQAGRRRVNNAMHI